jgi:hypothetical protein
MDRRSNASTSDSLLPSRDTGSSVGFRGAVAASVATAGSCGAVMAICHFPIPGETPIIPSGRRVGGGSGGRTADAQKALPRPGPGEGDRGDRRPFWNELLI